MCGKKWRKQKPAAVWQTHKEWERMDLVVVMKTNRKEDGDKQL